MAGPSFQRRMSAGALRLPRTSAFRICLSREQSGSLERASGCTCRSGPALRDRMAHAKAAHRVGLSTRIEARAFGRRPEPHLARCLYRARGSDPAAARGATDAACAASRGSLLRSASVSVARHGGASRGAFRLGREACCQRRGIPAILRSAVRRRHGPSARRRGASCLTRTISRAGRRPRAPCRSGGKTQTNTKAAPRGAHR